MKRFFILFNLYLVIILYLFVESNNIVADKVNNFQSETLIYALSFVFSERIIEHYVIIEPSVYAISIDRSCNGLLPFLALMASILARKIKFVFKLIAIGIAYILVSMINFFRIVFVIDMVIINQSNFSWSHDIVGNLMVISSNIAIFILFLYMFRTYKKKSSKIQRSLICYKNILKSKKFHKVIREKLSSVMKFKIESKIVQETQIGFKKLKDTQSYIVNTMIHQHYIAYQYLKHEYYESTNRLRQFYRPITCNRAKSVYACG